MNGSRLVCHGCGARVSVEADRCDLCGSDLSGSSGYTGEQAPKPGPDAAGNEEEQGGPPSAEDSMPATGLTFGVDSPTTASQDSQQESSAGEEEDNDPFTQGRCPACSWESPDGASFCGQCGTALVLAAQTGVAPAESVTDGSESGEAEAAQAEDSTLGTREAVEAPEAPETPRYPGLASQPLASEKRRNTALLAAAAVLLVGAMYMISEVSRGGGGSADVSSSSPAAPTTGPVPESIAAAVQELETVIASEIGSARQSARRRLADLYAENGRLDLAGPVLEELANELNTELDWIRAGNAYYDWMESLPGSSRLFFARKAIAAYERALVFNPDNLDVRTDLAVAYLYDPENMMQAILNTNLVLEKDSTHVQANFNRGVMLMQIGRISQAREQFEKVKRLVGDPQDMVFQRAEAAIRRLEDG